MSFRGFDHLTNHQPILYWGKLLTCCLFLKYKKWQHWYISGRERSYGDLGVVIRKKRAIYRFFKDQESKTEDRTILKVENSWNVEYSSSEQGPFCNFLHNINIVCIHVILRKFWVQQNHSVIHKTPLEYLFWKES